MEKTKVMTLAGFNTSTTNGALQNRINTLILFSLVLVASTVSAQKSKVMDVFFKYGIDSGVLNPEKTKRPDNYAFDFKQTIITSASEGITIAKFDPANSGPERWTVVSIDGKTPSKSAVNTFRKNQSKESPALKVDDASFRIEKETADQLVISYKVEAASLNKENGFIKDCRFYMTINIKSKKMDQIQTLNEKPVKVAILTADKFDLVVKYKWDDQAKQYLPVHEKLIMEAKFIGQATNVETITEYANYTKK
ncbi:hypothetical protein B0A67_21670 [Flavobacterium aquidurense]|uniref:hypothetical protein n=1 Tax=Flavobacterium aquidurense TaxID=362413 RepID=UPI0009125265|nr:hypothetical protein [Flavobacterium aquidurense]OXA67819.1 hypothetical protein B0A67_21670 [Flavobacterium aquidurense]SHF96493.1 hypothetical protein SAMN05444481_101276 [Flavobacterium frigidimaris]